MRLFLDTPAALWWMFGALVALVMHLLARPRTDARHWPSVRFLEATPLSLRRWSTLRDPWLLAARMALVCLAALAMAGPVIVTPEREREARLQTARAIVSDGGGDMVDEERRGAEASAVFVRPSLRDAVDEAAQWLNSQTAFRHEVVVISPFRRARVDASTFSGIEPAVGIRLVRISGEPPVLERELAVAVRVPVPATAETGATVGMALPNDGGYSVQAETNDGGPLQADEEDDDPDAPWPVRSAPVTDVTGQWTRQLERWQFAPEHTVRLRLGVTPMTALPLSVDETTMPTSATADEGQAVLYGEAAQGIRLPPSGLLSVTRFPWDGQAEALTSALASAAALPTSQWEPEPMTDAELRRLSREPQPSGDPTISHRSDRRWFWTAVLLLLGVETWLRGRRA